ncbi:MAG: S8 family serine peptidase, partial [Candidatus Kariarchaeaceae archaeon]
TSMATPHVAGAVALMLEAHPNANPNQVKTNLMANAKDVGLPTNVQGAGLVDLVEATNNWYDDKAIIFPTLTDNDLLYLTPGETFSGYFECITGSDSLVSPFIMVYGVWTFHVRIDYMAMMKELKRIRLEGHENGYHLFIPFKVKISKNTPVGIQLSRSIKVYLLNYREKDWNEDKYNSYWSHRMYRRCRRIFSINMDLKVEIVSPEDDAGKGFDAGDTFLSATKVKLGNYSATARDIDFYKLKLRAGYTYKFVLTGMDGYRDYDLALYNKTGHLVSQPLWYGGPTPEEIIIDIDTTCWYYLRVDPYSVLYLDPWYNQDTTGPYELLMYKRTTSDGGNGDTGTEIEFIGVSTWGIDMDSDSFNDYLGINITLDVISPGLIDAYAFFSLDKGDDHTKTAYGMAYTEMVELTTTGIQNITMFLDGTLIADQAFIGSHVLFELFMGDPSTFTILLDIFDVHTTQVYDSADFGPAHLHYRGLSFNSIDEDEDGVADWLEVVVTVEVLRELGGGSYFTATLYHPNGNFFWSLEEIYLDLSTSGEQSLSFWFNPSDFVTASSGLLDLELVVIYSWDHPLTTYTMHFGAFPYTLITLDTFTIDLADYTGGSQGELSFIKAVYDFGYDFDGDSKYDYLVLKVSFHIGTAGYYALEIATWFWSIPDQQLIFDFGQYPEIYWYEPGDYDEYILISGELINGFGVDGPYLSLFIWLEMFEYDPYWGDIYYIGDADYVQNYITAPYSADDFDTAGVILTGMSSQYIDTDDDGLDDSFDLILEVDVSYPGVFSFDLTFFSYPIDTLLSFGHYFDFYFDSAGSFELHVPISGRDIYRMEYSGYLELQQIDVWNYNDYTHVFFGMQNGRIEVDYEQMPGAAPPATIFSVDDYRPANLILNMDVYGGADYSDWVGYFNEYFTVLDPGYYTVTITIPAALILSRVYTDNTNFELWIFLFDEFYYFLDSMYPVYTDYYDLLMFETAYQITYLGDWGEDTNGNGFYESLIIEVRATIDAPGDYNVEMEISTPDYSWIAGYVEFIYADSPGEYIVTFRLPAKEILDFVTASETYFQLVFYLYDDAWNFLAQDGPVYTDWYLLSSFELKGSILSWVDYGVDSNENGLFEQINVEITVEIGFVDVYLLYMGVYAYSSVSGWYDIHISDASEYIEATTPGYYTLTFVIHAGSILGNAIEDTDFLLIIDLWDSNYDLIDFVDAYSQFYNLAVFEIPWAYSYWYETYDSNEDQTNDGVELGVDFWFSTLDGLVVDVSIGVYYWDAGISEYVMVDELIDGFIVDITTSTDYSVHFDWTNTYLAGDYAFSINVWFDGDYTIYDYFWVYELGLG